MSGGDERTVRTDVEPLTEAPPADVRRAQEERLLRAWKTPTGWRYWSAVNNSEVGRWYTGGRSSGATPAPTVAVSYTIAAPASPAGTAFDAEQTALLEQVTSVRRAVGASDDHVGVHVRALIGHGNVPVRALDERSGQPMAKCCRLDAARANYHGVRGGLRGVAVSSGRSPSP